MKSLVIILIVLFSTSFLAQNWTDVIDTDLDVSTASNVVDIFANGYGLHVIYQESNSLKYCRMDVEGNLYAGSPVTLESSSVVWPSIAGDANTIYVVYKKSGETSIKTKYSTDAGSSWYTLGSSPTGSDADFIESVYSEGRLHVTWQVSSQVKYSNFYESSWSTPYTVSSTENGYLPRIAAWNGNSEDKIYFYYQNSSSVCKWREYNVTATSWGNIQTAFSVSNSAPSGFAVDGNNIALFYNYYDAPLYYFQWVVKNKNNTLQCTRTAEPSAPQIVYSTTTVDEQMHAVFWFNWESEEQEDPGIWRSKGDVDCTIDEVYVHIDQEQQNVNFINTAASSNDVYVIWQDDSIGVNLRLIYDDADPLAPQGLAVNPYQQGSNFYAKLTWQLNNEPDVFIKTTNAYSIERRIKLLDGPWGSWSVVATRGGSVMEFIDSEVQGAGSERYYAEYRMRAVDYNNHYSAYSSSVMIGFSKYVPHSLLGGGLNSANKTNTSGFSDLSYNYNLSQNYPNPFNPSTLIGYSIKSAGMVTLKVFDILGNEVANLVDERKEPGNYSVEFNAANLPSGIYFYTLTSGTFWGTKKLILLK